jgi:hypothetical protein
MCWLDGIGIGGGAVGEGVEGEEGRGLAVQKIDLTTELVQHFR